MTDWIDKIFEIGNSEFAYQVYGVGIVTCVIALFCRLRGGGKNVF